MRVFHADNGRRAIFDAVHALQVEGKQVYPRGLETLEISPATFVIYDTADVLPTGINRKKLHPPIGAVEALQGIAGVSCPELMARVAPNFENFMNATRQFDGAYGPRLKKQLSAAYRRLSGEDDTRQAVAAIWDESDALRETSKDYPCTLSLHFLIREERLNLHVTMRSNDVWWGAPYDFFQFTQIQETMAHAIGRQPGTYWHTANSLHLYARDYEAAAALTVPRGVVAKHRVYGVGSWRGWDHASERAAQLLQGELPKEATDSEHWFYKQLAPYTDGTLA